MVDIIRSLSQGWTSIRLSSRPTASLQSSSVEHWILILLTSESQVFGSLSLSPRSIMLQHIELQSHLMQKLIKERRQRHTHTRQLLLEECFEHRSSKGRCVRLAALQLHLSSSKPLRIPCDQSISVKLPGLRFLSTHLHSQQRG